MKLLLAFFLVLLSACTSPHYSVFIGGQTISVELAQTAEERERGLMFRESLCETCGMLFLFEDEGYRHFWMKNTLIPLDMIFISTNFVIVDILEAEPCLNDPCQTYASKEKARYVLEVNKGFSKHYGVEKGDRIKIHNPQALFS